MTPHCIYRRDGMKYLNTILANLIRKGAVTVDIPGMDINELERLADGEAQRVLRKIAGILGCDEITDSEKIMMIRNYFE